MKIEVCKCPCCGGSFGAIEHEGMYECNYCNSHLLVKLNNNSNDPKHKLIVEEVKTKEEKEEPKVIPEPKNEPKVQIVLKDDEEKVFKDKTIKNRVLSMAAAIAVAAGMGTIGVATFNHIKDGVSNKDTKPKYWVTQTSHKIPGSDYLHDAPWDDKKTKVGDVVNYVEMTPEEMAQAAKAAQEITSALLKGEISDESAMNSLESIGIQVDPSFFEEIALIRESEVDAKVSVVKPEKVSSNSRRDIDNLDVIYVDKEGDTKLVHITESDVIACDTFGERILLLHPNGDGTYKDLTSDSMVQLNEEYWDMLDIDDISRSDTPIYHMEDGSSVVYADEVLEVRNRRVGTPEMSGKSI